jgi:hypothetical protein
MAVEVQVNARCRWISTGKFLDEDVDLGLGARAIVAGVRIPPPAKGLWLWGHKVGRPTHVLSVIAFHVVW